MAVSPINATAFFSQPLVSHIWTADPSAHVFENRVYVYPSHDRVPQQQNPGLGGGYDMVDYHVLSLPTIPGPVTDHGVALKLEDIPWASRQLWAPDAAKKGNQYYLYFPAKDHDNIFRIGVAQSDRPYGPFVPDPEPIPLSYSIDPTSFVDDNGEAYLYFGGIHGGQLQCWNGKNPSYDCSVWEREPNGTDVLALKPRVAKLSKDMKKFDGPVREVTILDPKGKQILADDHDRRFFEGVWIHKRFGKYYLSYSTGDTHFIVYAVGLSPWGPFTYVDKLMDPVKGWTTHHSIVEVKGKWFLFYHDSAISGANNRRHARVRPLYYDIWGKMTLEKPKGLLDWLWDLFN